MLRFLFSRSLDCCDGVLASKLVANRSTGGIICEISFLSIPRAKRYLNRLLLEACEYQEYLTREFQAKHNKEVGPDQGFKYEQCRLPVNVVFPLMLTHALTAKNADAPSNACLVSRIIRSLLRSNLTNRIYSVWILSSRDAELAQRTIGETRVLSLSADHFRSKVRESRLSSTIER